MRSAILLFLPFCWAGCPTDLVCDESFNKCYKYVSQSEPYFTAEEKCISFGGHLVSILNAFESGIIGESAASMFNGYNDYWIGANYVINDKWSWTDGTTWGYVDWFPGEPSTLTAASMLLTSKKWTSSIPDNQKPYVCELPYSASGSICPTLPPTTCPTYAPPPACPTLTQPPPPVCPTVPHIPHCESTWMYFAETNSCYKLGFDKSFWDAENICKGYGGHLTSIHSNDENEFVSNFATMGRAVDIPDCTWIGMYQAELQWYWTDGSETSYFSWGAWTNPGACIRLYPWGYIGATGWTNKWLPYDCQLPQRNFVCKKPAL